VRRARLVIERPASSDIMTLMIETAAPDETEAVAATVQAVTKLRAAVACVAPDSLPQDGKLIEDRRPIG
jgi:phenylacetate-CoA ligase